MMASRQTHHSSAKPSPSRPGLDPDAADFSALVSPGLRQPVPPHSAPQPTRPSRQPAPQPSRSTFRSPQPQRPTPPSSRVTPRFPRPPPPPQRVTPQSLPSTAESLPLRRPTSQSSTYTPRFPRPPPPPRRVTPQSPPPTGESLLLQRPTSRPSTSAPRCPGSPAPVVPVVPPPHTREHGMFQQAHDFVITNSQFIDSAHTRFGLEKLLKNSMPDAFHDSSARYPPPKCHLGTRKDYISLVTKWALGESDRKEPILWMYGPFGIGKSAVAQSCAETLKPMHKLAATLFFSRSNANRDDPRRAFTSLAYQIATICDLYCDVIDARILKDPALATKSLSTQFEELFTHPLSEIGAARSGLDGRVVIIDGLDECRGTAEQCEIIRVIATSAQERTTPFRWFITSRPDDLIIRTMNSTFVSPSLSTVELPVSREIDHEILVYLTDELKKVRESHVLPDAWPSEEAIALLVEHAAGLWIYISTIVRFINDENSFGPEDQLRIVLKFVEDVSVKVGSSNPLSEMDFFYGLIVERLPSNIKTTIRKILLIRSLNDGMHPDCIATTLCLSPEQFRRSCATLQSVMDLRGNILESMDLHFYHASFLDFLKHPDRSKELCIYGDFLIEYRQQLLEWLHQVCSRSTDASHLEFPPDTVLPDGVTHCEHYRRALNCFWELCSVPKHPLGFQDVASLSKLPFQKMLKLLPGSADWTISGIHFRGNVPIELRDQLVRWTRCQRPNCENTTDLWILGHGENETVIESNPSRASMFRLVRFRVLPDDLCRCGYPITKYGSR